ncbi:phage tail tube protein [Aeribacillus composti]|uniref:Phage tail tube protein n=1 Tax=Aeribacillus composti TaxID=1868734 RepID=A0ABY9WC38_9BACI|nr:phage tail tube protein [Aeribacillus composti]WNF31637.1 phage tail tube protein [Aeribacillus composti]
MAERAIGTKLKKGTTVIGELTSIGGLELSADTLDTTTLDSDGGYRTFVTGFKDAGEVSISGYFNPQHHKGLYDDFEAGTEQQYTIEFPPKIGAKWEFKAVVTGYSTGAELEDLISFEATLKVSGKPTLTVSGSGS